MKKISLLPLAAALLLGGGEVRAQYYTWNEDAPVHEITPGQTVVLRFGGNVGSSGFLAGNSIVSDGNNVNATYTFESADPLADQTPTYYLKQVSTGQYVSQASGQSGLAYTDDISEAFRLTAKEAVYYPTEEEANAEGVDYSTTTIAPVSEGLTAFVFTNTAYFEDGQTVEWICGNGGSAAIAWSYVNTNIWYIYESQPAKGFTLLLSTLNNLFPNGVSQTSWPVGDDPGHISQDTYDELSALFADARDNYNNATPADACEKMAADLQSAYERAKASMKPVTAGYYYLTNHRSQGIGVYGGTNANGREGVVWSSSYMFPAKPTVDDAAYIWQLEEVEGGFAIKNFGNGRYVGDVSSISTIIPFGTEALAHEITPQTAKSQGALFNIRAVSHSTDHSWNSDPNGNIVYWNGENGTADGNCFTLYRVDESAINAIAAEVEQNSLNQQLTSLLAQAWNAWQNARSYTSEATPDDDYTLPGLAADINNLSTNAQETQEGALENIIDLDLGTFFHSAWSETASTEGENNPHYLEAHGLNLNGATAVTLKMTQRWAAANQAINAPTQVRIDASTDGTTFTTVPGYENKTVTWQYPATYNDETRENYTALLNVDGLPEGTTAIRMVVLNTVSGSKNEYTRNVFFSLSEFRLYTAAYDAEKSLLQQVPEELRDALQSAIAKAQTELAEKAATPATITELSTALDSFLDNLPDPQLASDALSEARTLLEDAVEGNELGYFKTGSKATFEAALNEVEGQISDVMSLEEVHSVTAAIDAATEDFLAQLIKPEVGKFYVIRSSTTAAGRNYMLHATDNGTDDNAVQAGGYDAENNVDTADPEHNLNYLWFIESAEGRQITLRNAGTGLYMGHQNGLSQPVNLQKEPATLTIQYGHAGGCFNIVVGANESGANMYANLQGGTGPNIVGWTSATGEDNSALRFELRPFEIYGQNMHAIGNGMQILCFPYSILPMADQADVLYEIAGANPEGTQIFFKPIEDESIAAGQPFVYIPNEGAHYNMEGYDGFYLTECADGNNDGHLIPTYVMDGGNHNGLYGTVTGERIADGNGVIINNGLFLTNGSSRNNIAPNSGWISADYPKDYEPTEDLPYLELPEGGISGIGQAVVQTNERVDVYTVTGVLVRRNVLRSQAANGLPKGIYIIGGQKRLVK